MFILTYSLLIFVSVQKCTELGVSFIQPLISLRSERIEDAKINRKLEHWRSIALSSCEQSGRSVLPLIMAPISVNNFLINGVNCSSISSYSSFQLDYYSNLLKKYNLSLNLDKKSGNSCITSLKGSNVSKIFFDGDSKNTLISKSEQKKSFYQLATGPEGGFDSSEKLLFNSNNWESCSLGPRILRCETAPIAGIVALQCAVGDML